MLANELDIPIPLRMYVAEIIVILFFLAAWFIFRRKSN